MSAGYVDEGIDEFMIRSLGEFKSIDEIANTPISVSKSGKVIYVKDIARVENGFKEVRYDIRTNGKPTVMLWISKESGANTLKVSKLVKKELSKLKTTLPGNIDFVEIFDQGDIIARITSKTINTVIYGGIIAILIMFLFLRNWRPTLIISLAIPIFHHCNIHPVIPCKIYAEYYDPRRSGAWGRHACGQLYCGDREYLSSPREGHKTLRGGKDWGFTGWHGDHGFHAYYSCRISSYDIAGGFTGQLVRGLALTVSFSLFASLFVALTIVPMLASVIFKKRASGKEYKQVTGKFLLGSEISICEHFDGHFITAER